MNTTTPAVKRFVVTTATGYDAGHLGARHTGTLGSFDTLADARAARDAYNASVADTNSPAAFDHAKITDTASGYIVVGHGHYGNGKRCTSLLQSVDECSYHDVLFRGRYQQCEAFVRGI